ncbi:MAG: DUF3997 domain-containing protein [Flavobacteriales bacterium]|nr:MAG: DUF3997 domain-containing protein [Flavobacteriales bacterium]
MCIKKIYSASLVLMFLISCSASDYMDDLGDGYALVSESNANQYITGPDDMGKGLIPCTVEQINTDSLFIIASQRENPDCSDEMLSGKQGYWIIDKKKKKIYGPLDSAGFEKKKLELKVSLSLRR